MSEDVYMFTERDLARIFNERGYAVVGSFLSFQPGQTIPPCMIGDLLIEQPFLVLAETDRFDHDEQCRLLGLTPSRVGRWMHFYRVSTD